MKNYLNHNTGIYKITVVPTGKIYIGQAVDLHNRFQAHIRSARNDNVRDGSLPIHRAMRKYGLENIKVEVIEYCQREQLDNKERYWIKYYHAQDPNIGYNLANGGQRGFNLSGERHSQAKLSQKEVDEIIQLISEKELTLREIAKKYNVSFATICNINTGKNWRKDELNYPIRKNAGKCKCVANSQPNQERRVCSLETAYKIRQKYATYCPLEEIYNSFPEIKPGTIKAIIYRKGTCYDTVPFFDRKTGSWIQLQ